ncbi:phenylalanine--tRNA ligase subunit beta [Pseudothermotoga thermarum]|uniref:Phenylalanine--tRNA ligase beta subunit n=1 Tax=Pseudothermotoga thermarum DSM 5069 TaxID=688269 RepID=F7YY39_9THEM|nr:phenylalanine--tRNA ligase subunit beta [Pseudothermotoga thermarum]AEH50849.1 phenylalanyl-tRNA synthetase, beta subunit [Pseudothermotoga thermarum DSM 5069]
MLVPIEWLREFVEIDWSVDELAEKLTMAGLKVETILNPFAQGKIVCAEVVETSLHPESNKLKVCKVFDGENTYTTVTSDMKVEKGHKVAIAYPSTKLSNGQVVEPAKIKGVLSQVVMCSLEELGLEPKSEGVCLIDQIDKDIPIGADVIERWKLNEPVLDLEITSNRPDCLGIIGVAREVSVISGKQLKKPSISYSCSNLKVEDFVKVSIEDIDGCPRYCAAFVDGVVIKPSPIWVRRRLMTCGIRPINNVVDSTNYVMLETGHPTHAFDFSKVYQGTIVVRKAREKEKVTLLDEKDYELKGLETLITDPVSILAVGGVMGAKNSGVSEQTSRIILEVAYFNPVRIRKTAKVLGIKSDAAYRFERGVDPNGVVFVMQRLLTIVQKICNGSVAQGLVDVYPRKIDNRVIELRKEKISTILGIDPKGESKKILQSLEMKVEEKEDRLKVEVPTFRPDISIEEDLVEEIGRIYGYSKIEAVAPRIIARGRGWNDKQLFRRKIREHLIALGFDETINLSFCPSKLVSKILNVEPVKLLNPLTEDMDCLRPSLLFGLLDSLAFNYRRQMRDIKYFEIAKIFHNENGNPVEKEFVGAIATGRFEEENYKVSSEIDFFIFKGYLESLQEHFALKFDFKPVNLPMYVPGRSAIIKLENEEIGKIGMLASSVLEFYDLKGDVYFFELDLDKMFQAFQSVRPVKQLSSFPAIRRDISLLLPTGVYAGGIVDYLYSSSEYVEKAGVCDIYKGKDVPENMTSVTFYVVYRAPDRSLTDDEVNAIFEKTVKDVEERFGVKRRFS